MRGLSRIAAAAVFVAGFSFAAQAQSHSVRTSSPEFYGLFEGRSAAVESRSRYSAPVPPSESNTVMGLRVPR